MEDQNILLEKILELNATFTQCCICTKMKATLTCDACDTPCCLLCVKTSLLMIRYEPELFRYHYSNTTIKRCPTCFKERRTHKDIQIDSLAKKLNLLNNK